MKNVFEIPSCGYVIFFFTEFAVLGKNLSTYEEILKLYFQDHFSWSFLVQTLYFETDSIWRVKTMVV